MRSRLLLAAGTARHIAVAEFGGCPGVAFGIAGDRRGAELRGGEGLAALGAGDERIAELRGGRLARTSDGNDKRRTGLLLVRREDRKGQGKCHSKVECGFHLEQSTTKHGKDKTGMGYVVEGEGGRISLGTSVPI